MRLDSIDLIRFGHFCGRTVELPPRKPDYYLIYGDNEAGKSTLLRAISALLFEVPVNTPDVHTYKGPELRIGATISDGANRFSFRRRKGTSGTLLNANDGQIDAGALAPFLRELDQERFEQLFGLNHERLRQGGAELLRGHGDVGSALFQAAGLLELRHLQERLDSDAREIFSPKSRTRTIGRILNEYRQAKLEINRLAISGAAVKQKQGELEHARTALAKLKAESHSLQQELVRLRRIEGNKPDLAHLQEVRLELAALVAVPTLPGDARRQFDEATNTLANANSQISTLTQEVAQREKRIHDLPANNLLKAYEAEIRELNAGIGGYLQSVNHKAKRMRERDSAIQTAEADWKSVWPGPLTDANKLRNVYSCKEQILNLVAEHKGLAAELAMADEEWRTVQQEQVRLQEELTARPEVADPAGLLAAVEQAKALGATDLLCARLRSDAERLARDAQREMRKLSLWSGTLENLESLKVPLLATTDHYCREWEGLAETRRDLSIRRANIVQAIRQKEGELGTLTSAAAKAGEDELAGARARRDELWLVIRGSKKAISSAQAKALSGHLRIADEIADLRFANARDVAIHDRLVKEIGSAHSDQESIARDISRLEAAEHELRERWNKEWTALGAEPLSPSEMKEWMQARQSVLEQFAQSRQKEEELRGLEQAAASAAAQIAAKWQAMDPTTAPAGERLPVLLRMAENFAREKETVRRARDEVQRQLKSLSMARRHARVEECSQRMAEWSQQWLPQVRALLMPENSTSDQVAGALAVLERVFHQLDKAEDRQHRVETIGYDIEAFEARLSRIVVALGSPGGSVPAEAAVKQLHSQLVELGNAETQRETLEEQNEKDKATIATWRERAQQAFTTLEKLKTLANCKGGDGDVRQLDEIIAASERKSDLQQEQKRISDSLRERNANADIAQVEEEASAYDLDSLRADIAAKADRSGLVLEEVSTAASRQGELFSEFERLENSEEAALQAQKAEEALAQLRPAVAQYLRLRLAAEVLHQAIESYRERHQGPILTRASELFSRLTLGRHSGLTSDFGNDDKPVLVAIRANGERVHVEGLSDGTCDQLYLALRLAAIEHHVRTVAPCPVIFDDLLIHSDDTRASAALQVIGEVAKSTQVLFFTHHKRLAELGIRAGAQMIELDSLATAAVA